MSRPDQSAAVAASKCSRYVVVDRDRDLTRAINQLLRSRRLYMDMEWYSRLCPPTSNLVTQKQWCERVRIIQLAGEAKEEVFILDIDEINRTSTHDSPDEHMEWNLRRLFESPTVKIFFAAECDLRALVRTFPAFADLKVKNVCCAKKVLQKISLDEHLSKRVLTANTPRTWSLGSAVAYFLGIKHIEKGDVRWKFWEAPRLSQEQFKYAADDVYYLRQVVLSLNERLSPDEFNGVLRECREEIHAYDVVMQRSERRQQMRQHVDHSDGDPLDAYCSNLRRGKKRGGRKNNNRERGGH